MSGEDRAREVHEVLTMALKLEALRVELIAVTKRAIEIQAEGMTLAEELRVRALALGVTEAGPVLRKSGMKVVEADTPAATPSGDECGCLGCLLNKLVERKEGGS